MLRFERFVFKKIRYTPSGLCSPLNSVPSTHFHPTDMDGIH